ncbi:hypothetical protein B0H10DRAFT_2214718 [Mycena sp. CBHHK59/15]|nr:hypothetical protein B0H10DRAFT_2214718 [Mycena sp. CBHHK59/15]
MSKCQQALFDFLIDLERKKLIYLYFMNYAKMWPELVIPMLCMILEKLEECKVKESLMQITE